MELDAKKAILIGGTAVAGYALYKWWLRRRASQISEGAAVNHAVNQVLQTASQTEAQLRGLGLLPPWPEIGPRPRPPIGAAYSLTAFRFR
jgi:hypothetical protein